MVSKTIGALRLGSSNLPLGVHTTNETSKYLFIIEFLYSFMESGSHIFYPALTEGRIERIYFHSKGNSLITIDEEYLIRSYVDEARAARIIRIPRAVETTSDLVQ
jgi:hypothetical protein